tara:strand:+ start:16 stop:393 length:378 start_codon:yes stop_codon:yes gene_type:complete
MDSGTVSRFDVILKINNDVNIPCQLKRHLSPITVGLIMRMLPLSGNAHQMGKSIVYFETNLNSGIERKKTDFRRGDIAFLPAEGSICFYVDDVYDGKPMTPIGRTNEIEKLNVVKSSDILSLTRN